MNRKSFIALFTSLLGLFATKNFPHKENEWLVERTWCPIRNRYVNKRIRQTDGEERFMEEWREYKRKNPKTTVLIIDASKCDFVNLIVPSKSGPIIRNA